MALAVADFTIMNTGLVPIFVNIPGGGGFGLIPGALSAPQDVVGLYAIQQVGQPVLFNVNFNGGLNIAPVGGAVGVAFIVMAGLA
jgi:hypothetical protein